MEHSNNQVKGMAYLSPTIYDQAPQKLDTGAHSKIPKHILELMNPNYNYIAYVIMQNFLELMLKG